RQDHTSSPSALASPVKRAAASTAPRPASVTFAKRPSEWNRMAMNIEVIWVFGKPEYFCKGGWTRRLKNSLSGKSGRISGQRMQ
ncbi:MAG TPA: hypothetical protein VGI20_09960, partial [Rhizomicrobium sp.]